MSTPVSPTALNWWQNLGDVLHGWPDWAIFSVKTVITLMFGFILYLVFISLARRVVKRTRWNDAAQIVSRLRPGLRLLIPLLALQASIGGFGWISESNLMIVRHALSLGIVASLAWTGLSFIDGLGRFIKAMHPVDVADNYEARRLHTQISVLERAIEIFIVVIAIAVALMTFPKIRELGTSLLASAGIAGLIIGLAARPVVENLLGGLQIALTQPINIDDVVIVEGEWGRIEQITATYVVVKIWDDRRLIVPFSKFLSEPFQNWTRRTAQILGTVYLYTDYRVPLDDLRAELKRIVENALQWDGRVCNIQVTDTTERTMQVRALVSAGDSSKAWELRVLVREKLIEYLQREHPDSLPRLRVDQPADDRHDKTESQPS